MFPPPIFVALINFDIRVTRFPILDIRPVASVYEDTRSRWPDIIGLKMAEKH